MERREFLQSAMIKSFFRYVCVIADGRKSFNKIKPGENPRQTIKFEFFDKLKIVQRVQTTNA